MHSGARGMLKLAPPPNWPAGGSRCIAQSQPSGQQTIGQAQPCGGGSRRQAQASRSVKPEDRKAGPWRLAAAGIRSAASFIEADGLQTGLLTSYSPTVIATAISTQYTTKYARQGWRVDEESTLAPSLVWRLGSTFALRSLSGYRFRRCHTPDNSREGVAHRADPAPDLSAQ